jgi:hypothetical protein
MALRLLVVAVLFTSVTVAGQVPRPAPPAPPGSTAAPAPPAGAGIIRGVVTGGDTAGPLRGADVRVQGGSISLFEPRWARTDERGRFEVRDLAPGRYTVSVSKVGYLTLDYGQRRPGEGGRPVDVSTSTPVENIDILLPRGAVIVARVTDRYGDPLQGVSVRVYQYRFVNGERRLQQTVGGSGLTDDRGEQRIVGIQPGEYFVAASPALSQASVRGDAETYHPGTARVADAQPITVGIGEEKHVAFAMASVKRARLSGVIVGSAGGALQNPGASLQTVYLGSGSSRGMPVAPDGSFNEENLPPGEYFIEVRSPEWALQRFQLFGEDVTNVVITTKKPGAVRARLIFEGGDPPKEPIDIRPFFVGPACGIMALGGSCGGGSVGLVRPVAPADWTFTAELTGMGVLRLRGRPTTWSLKAVLVEGTDVIDTPVELSALEGKRVEIVLTQRRSDVSGAVTDARGQQTRDYLVVLFPEDEDQWTAFSRFIAIGRPDQDGRFVLPALPPGRYLIQAVGYLEPGEERNPETLARLRTGATSFSLAEGESRTLNLRVVP